MDLTGSYAMTPAASVSGMYFAHPQAKYFVIQRIGADQVGPANLFIHAMVGGVVRKDQEALATRVRPSSGAVFGLAAVWRVEGWPVAVALQCRGQVNAWQELDHFGSDPVSLQLGLRGWLAEGLIYELGAGIGVEQDVGAAWAVEVGVGIRF